jgi:exodeoxyribonuclease X
MIVVIDAETTGLDPETDRVVEIAAVRLEKVDDVWAVVSEKSCLVDPGRPIPAAASAVHHLTDSDVVDARNLSEAIEYLDLREKDVLVAHNADFDRGMLPGLATHPWICTWKVANKIIESAPSYSNQVLRYHLGLDVRSGDGRDGQPHSALYDARTTAQLMLHLLTTITAKEMVAITQEPVLLRKLGFGKHRGVEFAEIPKDYLKWLRGRDNLDRDLKHTLDVHLGNTQ